MPQHRSASGRRVLSLLLITSLQLYTGHPPFFDISEAQTIMSITAGRRPTRPRFFSGELMQDTLWRSVTECWDGSPLKRPNAEDVVKRLMLAPSQAMNALLVRRPSLGAWQCTHWCRILNMGSRSMPISRMYRLCRESRGNAAILLVFTRRVSKALDAISVGS